MLKKWIEITTVMSCPNNCVYCPQALLLKRYFETSPDAKKVLALEDFKTILKKTPKYIQINFAGMSEPFLNPETVDMLLYAHSQEYAVCVYTTLRGLSLHDIQRIRHIPFDEFCVHTPDADGILKLTVDKPYLEKIRLLKNCNIANLSFMTLGRNRMEIAEAAGQKVNAFPLYRRGDSLNIEKLPRQLWFIPRDCNIFKSVFCDRQLFSCNKKIPLPHLETMVMLPDGRVLLCCMDYGMKHVLGNLFEQSYEEILNGPAMKQVEAAMNGEIPGYLLCRSCELAHNYSTLSFLIFRLTGIYKDSLIRSIIRLPWFLIKNILRHA